ncbi:MAG: DNA polymerase III subunit gamma/tau [Bacteroidales bacterium]|nr:DNA polymerase III subunit gamma/tau [Bacteroidales bacterium]
MSQYIVSARKYRPESFETLIGQDNIARTLKNSIARGQLAHAYLFCGPRGVGKTTTARIFAKMINCTNPGPDMEPCGECESCLSFAEGRSYCIHELDAASNNSVDDIKTLMEKVQVPPPVGKYSVYIIDEVHMLSQSAFNAFLKTLEEPPAHAIFILATTEKHKILPTILSRCQTYDFNRISVSDAVRNLKMIADKEGVKIDDRSLHIIAMKADGAMRDALTIFDQTVAFCGNDIHYEDVIRNLNVLDYEYTFSMVNDFLKGDYADALLSFDKILAKGFNALHFVAALSTHLRDLTVAKTGGLDALLELPESLKADYKEQAARCPLKFLYDALGITTQCEAGYKAAVNPRLHIEYALMKLSFLLQQPAAAEISPRAPLGRNDKPAAPKPVEAPAPVISSEAEKSPAPKPAVEAPAPVISSEASPVISSEAEKSPAPRRRKSASLSLTDMMKEPDETSPRASLGRSDNDTSVISSEASPVISSEAEKSSAAPDADAIKAGWAGMVDALTAKYPKMVRLKNTLTAKEVVVSDEEDVKVVSFEVVNEAQKSWLEERLLREMETILRSSLSYPRINISINVTPEEKTEKVLYMPEEKAKDLIEKNSEVRELVKELSLDVK